MLIRCARNGTHQTMLRPDSHGGGSVDNGNLYSKKFAVSTRDFFHLHRVQTGPKAHPALCLMGTGTLSPGEAGQSPSSSADVKNSELHPYPHSSS
jgi:hypothetical protein